nr:tetratricopeptide repeat protein [Methylobacterium sp. L1A1]
MPAEPTLWDLHHHTEADWQQILASGPEQAASWVRFAADRGFRAAQLMLGQMHLDGHGVPRDPVAAYSWFERAAAIGSLDARNMLGRCHELGWGVPASHTEGLRHYRRAAAGGHAWGLYNLGCLLLYGDVRRNHAEAFRCFSAAAERADGEASSKALGMLARCHDEGWGTPVDRVAALQYYQVAAASKDCWATLNLGMIHLQDNRICDAQTAFEAALTYATSHCLPAIAGAINRLTDPRLSTLQAQAHERVQARGGNPRTLPVLSHGYVEKLRHGSTWVLNAAIIAAYSLKLFNTALLKSHR